MKIVARGCKYVRGKEGEQFFRRRIEAIRRGRIVKHDEATDGLTTSQQIAHESFGLDSVPPLLDGLPRLSYSHLDQAANVLRLQACRTSSFDGKSVWHAGTYGC